MRALVQLGSNPLCLLKSETRNRTKDSGLSFPCEQTVAPAAAKADGSRQRAPTVALRLGLWERTARTEILEQSTSAPRILSAAVADAIEALVGPPSGDLCRSRLTRTPSLINPTVRQSLISMSA